VLALGGAELAFFAWTHRGSAPPDTAALRRPGARVAYRLAGEDRVLETAFSATNLAVLQGGYSLWGYAPIVPQRHARFMAFTQGREIEQLNNIRGDHPDRYHPLLAALRARYLALQRGVREVPGFRVGAAVSSVALLAFGAATARCLRRRRA
jgi:hypothetical protein